MSMRNINAAREIISTRVIDFPRELVWKAWTDPVHLATWWGPKGFTNTFHEFNLKPGGMWRFIMHGPDGKDYKNESLFVEVEENAWIVFNHISAPQFQVTATFVDCDGKTKIVFNMRFESAAACENMKPICVPSNEQNFDRLEAELSRMKALS